MPDPNQGKKSIIRGKGKEKLRGLRTDSAEVQVSKTISWLLRHGAKSEGLEMRTDGYVRVTDLVSPIS
jgi:2'-phosphotransferase